MAECITALEYEHGIVALDSGQLRPQMAACYLMETGDSVAVIEAGSNVSTERILNVLRHRGRQPEEVSHVIVTHVHLDHAGGAGSLMAKLPAATLVVHPRGARHMIDPSRLEASARAVYGDAEFDRMYGTLQPVPEERVLVMDDGGSLSVGGRELSFMDTPGHARHHFCVWDELSRGWFTGDTFGLCFREFDSEQGYFLFPTTSPIQFDPPELIASVHRLMERNPQYMYLTHFGRVGQVEALAERMIFCIENMVRIAEEYAAADRRTERIETALMDWWFSELRDHGTGLGDDRIREILEVDVVLNTQGVEFWLDHR